MQADSSQVGDIDSLVVLFIDRLEDNLLLLVVHLYNIVIFWIGEISDAPFEPIVCILSDEDGIGVGDLHQVLLRVKAFGVFSNFIFPLSATQLLGTLPFTEKKFICGLISLLDQLCLVGEQIV